RRHSRPLRHRRAGAIIRGWTLRTTEPSDSRIDEASAKALILRLLSEYALPRWRYYVIVFVLMAVAGACTAASAWLAGDLINSAYLHKDAPGAIQLWLLAALLFSMRRAAYYC